VGVLYSVVKIRSRGGYFVEYGQRIGKWSVGNFIFARALACMYILYVGLTIVLQN